MPRASWAQRADRVLRRHASHHRRVAGALFSFIVSFDNVPVSIFLLGAGQMTLPVKIFSAIEYGVDPSIAAISTMLIVLTGVGLAVAERWIGFHRFV
jgi:putative spermidine/putrescine transport system permease protein